MAGANGAAGKDGAVGTKGDAGSPGANGQNLFLMNNDGTTVGPLLQASYNQASFLAGGFIWDVSTQNGYLSSSLGTEAYFRDAACSIPFGASYDSVGITANPQSVAIAFGTNGKYDSSDKVYRPVGVGLTFSSQANIYSPTYINSGCATLSPERKSTKDADGQTLFELNEISARPTLVLPLTVVSK